MEGIIKTLKLRELVGYGDLDKAVWPVTSTGAIFSSDNKSLEEILADLYSKIKNGGSGTGGNTGGDGGEGDSGDSGNDGKDGKDGKTYDYVPCFIYCHADSVPTSKPIGGSYDFTTKTLNPPDGWSSSYANMDKPIYMSIGIACSKDGSKIEWSYPFVAFSDGSKGDDLPYQPVPESNYKTLFAYQHNLSQPDIPVGGTYNFDTQTLENAPSGWQIGSKEGLDYPVYMSVGFCSKSKPDVEWSYPVIIADSKGLGPGKTPGSDLLKRVYVAVIYQESSSQPATPASTEGSVDFNKTPYEFTPPTGWSTDASLAVNADTWCSIKAFYQTADGSYDNSTTEWSTPVKANLTKLTLTEAEMNMIAGRISITSNDIETAFNTWIAQGSNIQMIANKIAETADIYTVTAGQYVVNADFIEQVANKVISVSNFKQDVIMDASGKIVAQITADESGLYSTIANNIVQEAIKDKDNEGGIIYLVAKDVTDNIKSEIEVGTDDSGNGFIKAIANNIDFNSNAFNSIVTNATNGKVTTIMQTEDTIALIKKAANDTATSLIMGEGFIKMVADKVDIVGSLNTTDLTINGGASYFSKDGNGHVANGNFEWDQTGNIKLNNNAAQFKTDGSGQVANGNVSWDKDGNVSINNKATVFKTDGSGQLAKGNINWNSNGDINFIGRIVARNFRVDVLDISDKSSYTIDKNNIYSHYLVDTTSSSYAHLSSINLPNAYDPEINGIEVSITIISSYSYLGTSNTTRDNRSIKLYSSSGIRYIYNISTEATEDDVTSYYDYKFTPKFDSTTINELKTSVILSYATTYIFKALGGHWVAINGYF